MNPPASSLLLENGGALFVGFELFVLNVALRADAQVAREIVASPNTLEALILKPGWAIGWTVLLGLGWLAAVGARRRDILLGIVAISAIVFSGSMAAGIAGAFAQSLPAMK